MPLEEQSVKKQAINRYYFSIASIQSSKESSNYNKIICFTGVVDTGQAPEKSNISANIRKKLKSLLGMSTGTRRSCLKKKTRGEKSGGTVPLSFAYGWPTTLYSLSNVETSPLGPKNNSSASSVIPLQKAGGEGH
jgi:hypothetical protein